MPTEIDAKLPQPTRGRRASSAADDRMVRKIDAGIFAKLLPRTTKSLTLAHHSANLRKEPRSDSAAMPGGPLVHTPLSSVAPIRKETLVMKAYRTESPYYFSSRQLLPAGSLVFFSNKINRYVHPTDGVLFDPHPRLQVLSDAESQALEEHWRDALSSY